MSTVVVATVKSNSSSPPVFQNTSGTEVGTLCRAWVSFNGSGTVAIRAQFNVSSITDNGVGDYTVNFTTALADTNYAIATSCPISPASSSTRSGVTLGMKDGTLPATSSVTLMCKNGANTAANAADLDTNYASVSVFR